MRKQPFFRQYDSMDCGPTCLKMISAAYGKNISLQKLRDLSYLSKEGVSLAGLYQASESIGFRTMVVKLQTTADEGQFSLQSATLPCIAHWDQKHFVVVYKLSATHVWIADPAAGKLKVPIASFRKYFETDHGEGIAILLEPTNEFYDVEFEKEARLSLKYLFGYFRPYRKFMIQLFIGILASVLLQLIFPFLTQAVVDVGITTSNVSFIVLILIAQLVVFVFSAFINMMQRWILLQINSRISIQLVYDFLSKLMKLPFPIFESKNTGDIYQRMEDNKRVETFLSNSFIPFIMGGVSFIVFGIVLALYSFKIFFIYLIGLSLYLFWITSFMKKRKSIDYIRFQETSANQTTVLELLRGMPEIKLQGSQIKRRQQWLSIQSRLFRAKIQSLILANWQDFGGQFINQLKDILIIFVSASEVISGQMTLGMMIAVQYIIGQLNVPVLQLAEIIREGQDAALSLTRMNELYSIKAEEETFGNIDVSAQSDATIVLRDVSFRYNTLSDMVLKNINLVIPQGKTIAIVGASGSGKTTLLKLLLGNYSPVSGAIKVGDYDFSLADKNKWRKDCGAVMQDGFIFSDSIANNIAESSEQVDKTRLLKAVKVANIQSFIEKLPLAYNTQIGPQGIGLSQGQQQRLLIARAVYKEPKLFFFDESTNALDANNEKAIVANLNEVTKGCTVIIVAHRLSTVKNADKIIVLDEGKIIEEGTHRELVELEGAYFNLIRNQLELGK